MEKPSFWSQVKNFFDEVGHSFKSLYHIAQKADFDVIAKDAIEGKVGGQGRTFGYICHNSFGLRLKNNTSSKAAFFDLGDGNDVISGFTDKPNSFHLGSGRKNINGSDKNDIFILKDVNITGILDGLAGRDIVDISGIDSNASLAL
uniref:Uncharacterized protein n=1 Tax=Romanomermis culicivorax TaxID=13658 RepID=A0A915I6W7_ROMCU